MVRFKRNLNIALSPLALSPNKYTADSPKEIEISKKNEPIVNEEITVKEQRPASGTSKLHRNKVTAGSGE